MLAWGISLVFAVGCGGAPPPPVVTVAPEAPPPEPGYAWFVPDPHGPMLRVDPEGDLVLGANFRARLGDPVEIADQVTSRALRAAVRLDDGWLFVDEAGALLRADDFLGPLALVGYLPPHAVLRPSRGRLVAQERGRLLTTAGRRTPAPSSFDGLVLEATFHDGDHGALIAGDGALLRTADGGRSWTPVSLGPGEVALRVAPTDDGVHFATTDRVGHLRPDGAIEEAATPHPFNGLPARLSPRQTRSVRRAIWSRHPRLAAIELVPVADRLIEGDVSSGRVAAFDAASGRRLPDVVLPAAGPCLLEPWGDGVAARCPPDGALFHSADGVAFRRVPIRGGAGSSATFSPFSALAVREGRCDDPHADRRTALCVFTADGAARTVERDASEIDDLQGTTALLDGSERWTLLDLETGLTRAIVAPDDAAIDRAWLVGDGTVLAVTGGDRPRLLAGPGHALAPLHTPGDGIGAALLGARDGFAVTPQAFHVTRDGGGRWTALSGPESFPMGAATGAAELRCGRRACVYRRRVLLSLDPPAAAGVDPPVVGEAPAAEPAEPAAGLDLHAAWFPSFDCEVTRRERRRSRTLPSGWSARASTGRATFWARLEGDSEQRLAWATRLRVRATLPGARGRPDSLRLELHAADERHAIVSRCFRDGDRFRCELLFGRTGRAIAVAPGPELPRGVLVADDARRPYEAPRPVDAVMLDDGGVLGLFRSRDVDVVVRYDAGGVPVARRAFRWPRADRGALARRAGEAGYVVARAERDRVVLDLFPVAREPSAPATVVGRLAPHPLAACGAGPAEGTVSFSIEIDPSRLDGAPLRGGAIARVEAWGGQACVREVMNTGVSPYDAAIVALAAEPDGRLVGSVDDGDERRPLVCTPRP